MDTTFDLTAKHELDDVDNDRKDFNETLFEIGD